MCAQYIGHGWYWNWSGIFSWCLSSSYSHVRRGGICLQSYFAVNPPLRNITHNTPQFVVSPAVKEATRRLVLANLTFNTCAMVDVLFWGRAVRGSRELWSSSYCWYQILFCHLLCSHFPQFLFVLSTDINNKPNRVPVHQLHAAFHQVPVAIRVTLTPPHNGFFSILQKLSLIHI